jgi:hypothetical protein
MVLALFSISRQVEDDDGKWIPFPNPGEQVSLRFPQSMSLEPAKIQFEEICPGTLINVPVNIDDFNMAALIRRPDSSSINVLQRVQSQDIHFESPDSRYQHQMKQK